MPARTFETPFRVSIKPNPTKRFGDLTVEYHDVENLKKSRRNARTHSKKQIEQIVQSIRRFGFTCPLLIDENGNIIAGHGRLQAAIKLGLKTVPIVRICNLNDTEKRALALADNKIASNAGWDRPILAAELDDLAKLLPEIGCDLSITGFDAPEIDNIFTNLRDNESEPTDQVPKVEAIAVSRSGDLWCLGPHRLMCGDATEETTYKALFGSVRAKTILGDPPWNLSIRSLVGRGKRKHREFVRGSGELDNRELFQFFKSAFTLSKSYSVPGALHYWFMGWQNLLTMQLAGRDVYGDLKNIIAWVKSTPGQGSLYRSQHEFILLYKNGDTAHTNNIELGKHGRNRSNVWNYAGANTFRKGRLEDLSLHPTVKPVRMIADAMLDCSRRGDIILDPFLGSGTTLMAAEMVGRICYGIELDPLYADTAIRRWQEYTKQDAILKSTGQPFDEIAKERPKRVRIRIPRDDDHDR